MESASLCSSSPPSSLFLTHGSKPMIKIHRVTKRVSPAKVYASSSSSSSSSSRDQSGRGHRLVDENMIVLRKRIHEMKMVERNYEPPENWTEWEKKYYTSYDSFICEAMGVLQTHLMNTRPSLALGAMALIALSVPTSTALLCSHLMEMTNEILAVIRSTYGMI